MTRAPKEWLTNEAWIALEPRFVPDDRDWLARLSRELPLRTESIRLFGRDVAMPRLVSYHGDADATYRYSGRAFSPSPWTPQLDALRERVERAVGAPFNSALVNLYRDGDDSMGEHADDEPELGPRSPDDVLIASLSLGARRRFTLRARSSGARTHYELGDGDLFVMGGATQRDFTHALRPTSRAVDARMNITFRQIVRDQNGGLISRKSRPPG